MSRMIPFEGLCGAKAAQYRLDKFLVMDKDGFQSEDIETCLIMKSGYVIKIVISGH